jgi:CheY-like chemotaxis protein
MKRVMLIEDNEISLRFIADAVALLPVQVDECRSFTEAKAMLEQNHYDLILSDIHLEDGDLFHESSFLPRKINKIAMSAEITPGITNRLKALGIDCVLAKPISISEIHATVIQQLEITSQSDIELALWDDNKALSALGNNSDTLRCLKDLFKAELPQMLQQIDVEFNYGNYHKITDILHKLKASCGFLGANKLLAQCYSFERNISQQSMTDFMLIAKQTIETI